MAQTKSESGTGDKGMVSGSQDFLRGVRAEAKKVTWPEWKDTRSATGVVLIFVAVSSVFLGSVDFLFSKLMEWLVH